MAHVSDCRRRCAHFFEIFRKLRYRLFDVRVLRRTGSGAPFGVAADFDAGDALTRLPEEPHVLALPLRGLPLGAPPRSSAKAFAEKLRISKMFFKGSPAKTRNTPPLETALMATLYIEGFSGFGISARQS